VKNRCRNFVTFGTSPVIIEYDVEENLVIKDRGNQRKIEKVAP
jgi:hypothetical protein